jgi:hypothetical protein
MKSHNSNHKTNTCYDEEHVALNEISRKKGQCSKKIADLQYKNRFFDLADESIITHILFCGFIGDKTAKISKSPHFSGLFLKSFHLFDTISLTALIGEILSP